MPEPGLAGDERGLAMATPLAAARVLAGLLPPGPVLELCCGLGGATRALASQGRVLAVDRDPVRLKAARTNLRRLGLAEEVTWLACDLTRPAREWASHLEEMTPPAASLARWALDFSPRLALRLPPGLARGELEGLGPWRPLRPPRGDRLGFFYALLGDWPLGPEGLDLSLSAD